MGYAIVILSALVLVEAGFIAYTLLKNEVLKAEKITILNELQALADHKETKKDIEKETGKIQNKLKEATDEEKTAVYNASIDIINKLRNSKKS